jgi:hypothetical protein
MSHVVTREYKKNGTNLERGIGSIECKLSKEDNKTNATILDGSSGRVHSCCTKMEKPLED